MKHSLAAGFLLATAFAVSPAFAGCTIAIAGTRCVIIPAEDRVAITPGMTLPDEGRIVLNPDYYGLPAVDGFWRYYSIGREIYRVRPDTLEILERVNGGNRQLF